jgi:50S ribosome-binding GTPase
MAYDYSELVSLASNWAQQAAASGWLNPQSARQLSDTDTRSPETLFDDGQGRPLVVAFMGGTGVGKSSLLNRLAGKPIAKSGIERPTSREVTLYHHQDIAIRHLPEKLPIEKIKVAQHDDDHKRSIVWVDMPDFDSTEQSNKVLVFEWLPHIDVLIYVVSPERYRDEKAWRLLLSEGNRHAWLFVLNQWDRGQQAQLEDFQLQLGKAGFDEPLIFKTVCGDADFPDDFAKLETTLFSLANEHIIAELKLRGAQVRSHELKQKLDFIKRELGPPDAFNQAREIWRNQWETASEQLRQGFVWPIQKLSAYYADNAGSLIMQSGDNETTKTLWDNWAQSRFEDALGELAIQTGELGVPPTPLKNQLAAIKAKPAKIVQNQAELRVRKALAKPGNALHRGLLRIVRFCEIVLPLAASCWVGYQVFRGYYAGNEHLAAYLGVDFAIHSTLLIALSWLIPWFISRQLKPSLVNTARTGLNNGIETALAMIDGEVQEAIDTATKHHAQHLRQINEFILETGITNKTNPHKHDQSNNPLSKMLIN